MLLRAQEPAYKNPYPALTQLLEGDGIVGSHKSAADLNPDACSPHGALYSARAACDSMQPCLMFFNCYQCLPLESEGKHSNQQQCDFEDMCVLSISAVLGCPQSLTETISSADEPGGHRRL